MHHKFIKQLHNRFIILYLFFAVASCNAQQFLYPVADFDNGNKLVLIYQKSLENIELWFFDQENQVATKGLSSFITPANVRILPSENSFSFIDQGYIKIKNFAKRSAKTLAIYEPISLITSMNWIDDHTFYFVAREGDNYQIFQGDVASNIKRLSCKPIDFLYPQKIDDKLFCIQRNEDCHFKIISQHWNPVNYEDFQPTEEIIIVDSTKKPLCFLQMKSKTEGFYIQAPDFKDYNDDDIYEFICFHLCYQNEKWNSEQLFSFRIPLKYIHGSQRLYESIEPFLPNYNDNNCIYFSSYNETKYNFEISAFLMQTKEIFNISYQLRKSSSMSQQLFAPYILHSNLLCGMIFLDTKALDFMQYDLACQLPSIFIK